MRDGPVRTTLKSLALLRFWVDLGITRLIRRFRGEPEFMLRGSCVRSGCCCETPMIEVHPLLFFTRWYRRLFLGWHRRVNGFELLRSERDDFVFVFRCTHFDHETRRCDSYATRPGMCRDYPRAQLWTTNPCFLEGCGYYALSKRADRMRAALDREDLTPEQRRKLETGLHLKE